MAEPTSNWLLGIDLGTTNTAAVAFAPDRPGPISITHGRNQPVIPSVVSLKNPQLPLVGWLAKDMMLTDPLTTIYGWKRFIGRSERSEYVGRYRDRFPFRIHSDPNGALGAVMGGTIVPLVDIAAMVLDQVRLQTSATVGHDVRDCVISVPAHFANAQRNAVLEAGRQAGLNVLRLINEPTAAAMAFGMERQLDSCILIFDLGGGTFDATVLELVDNIFDVKATRGDGFLGGIDFDRAVMQRLVSYCKEKHRVDPSEEPVVAQRLLNAAENAKCALSSNESTEVNVPMVGHDRRGRQFDLCYKLDRRELESLTAPLVERTLGIVEEMIDSAGYSPRSINHIIVTGGQSRMPLVRRRIEEALGRAPLAHLDPDTCVAHGAALVARSHNQISGAILLDVLSVPIGIVFPGGRTQFLFKANASLPASKRVPVQRPPGDQPLSVGLWQGPDITSTERQALGVIRVPSHLFAAGERFWLEIKLSEDLCLQPILYADNRPIPLLLEGA